MLDWNEDLPTQDGDYLWRDQDSKLCGICSVIGGANWIILRENHPFKEGNPLKIALKDVAPRWWARINWPGEA